DRRCRPGSDSAAELHTGGFPGGYRSARDRGRGCGRSGSYAFLTAPASWGRRKRPPAMVPNVSRACPETCETPLHACIRTTIAQASPAICDMRAKNVEIVCKAQRWENVPPQRCKSRQKAAFCLKWEI